MTNQAETNVNDSPDLNVKKLVAEAVGDLLSERDAKAEPAHRAELEVERKKRESLERKLNELIEENNRNRALAEAMERETKVKTELQRLGVQKVDLAFKAIKDDVVRTQEGQIQAKGKDGVVGLGDYLKTFLEENPELLPARNLGGSGTAPGSKQSGSNSSSSIDLDSIRPGMSQEEMARVRREIARLAGHINE